jgi:hypothetical protein
MHDDANPVHLNALSVFLVPGAHAGPGVVPVPMELVPMELVPMELVPMELVPMELVPMELVRGVNVRGEAAGTRRAQGFACPRSGDGRPGSGAVVSSGPSERRGANVGQVSRGPPERYLSTPLSPGSAGAAGPARTPRSDGVCEQPQGSGTEIRSVAKEDFYLS